MNSIWWFVAAFFAGAAAAVLVFASIIVLFALTKVALGKLKSNLRAESMAGVDHVHAGHAYRHPAPHLIAIQ